MKKSVSAEKGLASRGEASKRKRLPSGRRVEFVVDRQGFRVSATRIRMASLRSAREARTLASCP